MTTSIDRFAHSIRIILNPKSRKARELCDQFIPHFSMNRYPCEILESVYWSLKPSDKVHFNRALTKVLRNLDPLVSDSEEFGQILLFMQKVSSADLLKALLHLLKKNEVNCLHQVSGSAEFLGGIGAVIGLVHVDYETERRIVLFLKSFCGQNGVNVISLIQRLVEYEPQKALQHISDLKEEITKHLSECCLSGEEFHDLVVANFKEDMAKVLDANTHQALVQIIDES